MNKLIITEKPSVGAAYAALLGAKKRMDGYWEGNGYENRPKTGGRAPGPDRPQEVCSPP